HTDRQRSARLFWGNSQRRQQVGKFGGSAQGVYRRTGLGIPGGAPRFVGLRRSSTTYVVHLEGWNTGSSDKHKDGPRVRAQPSDGQAAAARGGKKSSAVRHTR